MQNIIPLQAATLTEANDEIKVLTAQVNALNEILCKVDRRLFKGIKHNESFDAVYDAVSDITEQRYKIMT